MQNNSCRMVGPLPTDCLFQFSSCKIKKTSLGGIMRKKTDERLQSSSTAVMDTMQVGGLEKPIQVIQNCVCLGGNTIKNRRRLLKLSVRHTSTGSLGKSKAYQLPVTLKFPRNSLVWIISAIQLFLPARLCPAWHTEPFAAYKRGAHLCCLYTHIRPRHFCDTARSGLPKWSLHKGPHHPSKLCCF